MLSSDLYTLSLIHQGERKRKSVRGAIVGPDLSVLNLVVVKRGEAVSSHISMFVCAACIVRSSVFLSSCSFVCMYLSIQHVTGLTDSQVPRRLGPKRANKIRKLFNLSKVSKPCPLCYYYAERKSKYSCLLLYSTGG